MIDEKKLIKQRNYLYVSVFLVCLFVAFGILQQTEDLTGQATKLNKLEPLDETKTVNCKNGSTISCEGKNCTATKDGQMAPDGSGELTGRCHCDGQKTKYCPQSADK